jgi:chromosome segregation ATPase
VNDDSAFFERLGHDVELEMKKQPERRVSESQMVSQSLLQQSPPGNEGADDMVHIVDDITQSPVEESARVAHAMDKLEKRDKTIASLRTENKALMDQMKEVKGRNQKLCKILGQGEFSTKTQLLEHIEELTTVKNEMTAEVERLHSLLEQERSRNKSLQAELTKHTSKAGKPRHN